MTFTVEIDTDNAAFDDPDREIARILYRLALRINGTGLTDEGVLHDANGNLVGSWSLS